MKITFNDGQEVQIQQVTEQTDGALLIKTISASEDQLKTLFSDPTTTKRMSVSERDEDTVVYENYTKLDAIVKYTAGILGVLMYREGEDPDSRIAALETRLKEAEEKNMNLQSRVEKAEEKNEMLEGCILEMSETVYQLNDNCINYFIFIHIITNFRRKRNDCNFMGTADYVRKENLFTGTETLKG